MRKVTIKTALVACSILGIQQAHAGPGTGAGSSDVDNSIRRDAATDSTFEYSESFYIGPNAVWDISGVYVIYSKNVWISPGATISGTGKIIFADPGTNPFWSDMTAGPTNIDDNNGNAINLNIEHQNPSGMVITDIADPGYGTGSSTDNSLNIGAGFNLGVDGANVTLGNGTLGNFVFGPSASITNYGVNRMVITNNSVISHMVAQNQTTSFTYPIGIAAGDYTPATITPTSVQTLHVSVTDYTNTSATILAPMEGMDRAWHIYGDAASIASVTLHHNTSTDGSAYTDNLAFITQYQGSGVWSSSATPDYTSAGVHTHSGLALGTSAADNASWLTKTSDAITPLPVTLISFTAHGNDCSVLLDWTTAQEENFNRFEIERSTDGRSFAKIATVAAKGNNSTYTYTDKTAPNGSNQYHLKMVNNNNQSGYSDVAVATVNCGASEVSVYPNPTHNTVKIKGLTGNEKVQVYDALGRKVISTQATNSMMQMDLSPYANGMYSINILSDDDHTQVFKVSKND